MPNVAKVLKDEITRLARKEAKSAISAVRKPTLQIKKTLGELKRRMAELERATRRLQTMREDQAVPSTAVAATASEEGAGRARITAKGMRSLRRKLGLTAAKFAKLLNVTQQSVFNWEKKQGALHVRGTTKQAILNVRNLGAREVRQRLEGAKGKSPARKRK